MLLAAYGGYSLAALATRALRALLACFARCEMQQREAR